MDFLTNLTLGKKIALLTAIGLLLGVGVFSSLGMRAVAKATETTLEDRLTTASLVAGYIDEAVGRALDEVQYTANRIDGPTSQLGIQIEQIDALEDTFSRISIYVPNIFLLDARGHIIWSRAEDPRLPGLDLSPLPGINEAIATGKPTVSGLASAPMTNTPVVFLSSPTKDGNGYLVAAVDLAQSSIGGFVRPIRLGQTGYVEIVDQSGVVLARTSPGPTLAPFEKSDHSGRFATLIEADKPTQGVCHTCHEQKVEKRDVLAFVPLSRAKWGVVIRQSETEALAPTRQLRQNLIFFGVGLVSVALLFVVVTTRDVGTRIKNLTVASQKIAEGDLSSPVSALGKDEVGILSETLDDMRVKLKTSYDDLEQKTKELSSLLSVSEIMTSTVDLSHLFEAVVAKAVDVVPGAVGGALLLRDEKDQLALQCAIGLDEGLLSRLASEASLEKSPDLIAAEIVHRNRPVGSLVMVSSQERAFTDPDQRLLQGIADYIAIAIERAQLTKEAEEARALHEADRLRSQFISSVSHELRTPLTLIKGYSTSLLRDNVSWDEQTRREFLQIIDEKTDELRDLIDKLLQSAKLEAGALKLEKEPVLLPRVAQKVVEDVTLRARKHQFILDFPQSFPVVEADVRCMEQVLRNLVQNAVKYSPEGSEIKISGVTGNGKVVIGVKDEGIGISPEYHDNIFERFYRVDEPSTRGIHGSGLGLSIVKGHVEAHGGQVWLKSTPGQGSTFYFSLPLEQAGNDE